jgi:hypothetical protein
MNCLKKICSLVSEIDYTPSLEIKGAITYTRNEIKIDGKKIPDLSSEEKALYTSENDQIKLVEFLSTAKQKETYINSLSNPENSLFTLLSSGNRQKALLKLLKVPEDLFVLKDELKRLFKIGYILETKVSGWKELAQTEIKALSGVPIGSKEWAQAQLDEAVEQVQNLGEKRQPKSEGAQASKRRK